MSWISLPIWVYFFNVAKKIPLETLVAARARTGLNNPTQPNRVNLNADPQAAGQAGNCAC